MSIEQESGRESEEAAKVAWDALTRATMRVESVAAVERDRSEAYRAIREVACRAWVAESVAMDAATAAWEALKAATSAVGSASQETVAAKEALVEAEAAYEVVSRGHSAFRIATPARGWTVGGVV